MKRLAIYHLSHQPPKYTSTAVSAAASDTPTSVKLRNLETRLNFSVCRQSYSLHFHALRIRYKTNSVNNTRSSVYSPSPHRHKMATKTSGESTASSSPSVIRLKPIEATPDSFQQFGQVIEASPDSGDFGPHDAQLDLSHGVPRFYIMHLKDRPLEFSSITHHASVTQCLGSIGGRVWYLGVAKPSIVDPSEIKGTVGANLVRSRCGHLYVPPSVDDVRVFKISGPKFLKLHRGTWHAGPLFLEKTMDFYNLELSNTNVADHTTHDFIKENKVIVNNDKLRPIFVVMD